MSDSFLTSLLSSKSPLHALQHTRLPYHFVKSFVASIDIIMGFCFLTLLVWEITLIDIRMLNWPLWITAQHRHRLAFMYYSAFTIVTYKGQEEGLFRSHDWKQNMSQVILFFTRRSQQKYFKILRQNQQGKIHHCLKFQRRIIFLDQIFITTHSNLMQISSSHFISNDEIVY